MITYFIGGPADLTKMNLANDHTSRFIFFRIDDVKVMGSNLLVRDGKVTSRQVAYEHFGTTKIITSNEPVSLYRYVGERER